MFKPKSDAIKIGNDSFKIVSRGGNAFTENNIIRFDITRNCGFVDLANSYLEMEVLLENPSNTAAQNLTQPMTQLDRDIGAQSLISQLTIRSQDGGRVLEELRNYNTYAKIHYNATHSEKNMNKRSKLEGCAPSYMPQDNPYCTNNRVIQSVQDPGDATTGLNVAADTWKPIRRKVCLPLLGGLFTNPRSFPALMLPCEVEIILEEGVRAMRLCNRGDALSFSNADPIPNPGAVAAGSPELRRVLLTQRSEFNAPGDGTAVSTVPANGVQPLDGQQNLNGPHNCWFRVGQQVRVSGTGAAVTGGPNYDNADSIQGVVTTITSIKLLNETHGTQNDRGKIALTFADDIIAPNAGVDAADMVVGLLDRNGAPLAAGGAGGRNLAGHGTFSYQIFNPRLVVQKVIPPPAVVSQISAAISRGEYNQDIVSYVNIDNAIPANQNTSTNIMPIDLTRCKSILSVPCSQSNTNLITNSNAIQGLYLNASEAQWSIDTKLIPDRRIDLNVERFPAIVQTPIDTTLRPYRVGNYLSGFHRYECEKALRSANIDVVNMNLLNNNPTNYDTGVNFNALEPGCWFVGRSLGAGVGTSQNLTAKSVLLYLNYQTGNNISSMVKLLKNFIVHVRTISIGMDGVSVYY